MERVSAADYRQAVNEFIVRHSTAKHAKWNRDSYMVGALARVNNNHKQLHPEAQKVMQAMMQMQKLDIKGLEAVYG